MNVIKSSKIEWLYYFGSRQCCALAFRTFYSSKQKPPQKTGKSGWCQLLCINVGWTVCDWNMWEVKSILITSWTWPKTHNEANENIKEAIADSVDSLTGVQKCSVYSSEQTACYGRSQVVRRGRTLHTNQQCPRWLQLRKRHDAASPFWDKLGSDHTHPTVDVCSVLRLGQQLLVTAGKEANFLRLPLRRAIPRVLKSM